MTLQQFYEIVPANIIGSCVTAVVAFLIARRYTYGWQRQQWKNNAFGAVRDGFIRSYLSLCKMHLMTGPMKTSKTDKEFQDRFAWHKENAQKQRYEFKANCYKIRPWLDPDENFTLDEIGATLDDWHIAVNRMELEKAEVSELEDAKEKLDEICREAGL